MSLKVLCVGGLGSSQMDDVVSALTADGYDVDPGAKWDGYKSLPMTLAKLRDDAKVAIIGHSMAGIPEIDAMADPRVIFVGMIDPVSDKLGARMYQMPPDPPAFVWYQRLGFGVEVKLHILGAGAPVLWPGGHNEIVHDPELIADLVDRLKNAVENTH